MAITGVIQREYIERSHTTSTITRIRTNRANRLSDRVTGNAHKEAPDHCVTGR